MEQAWVGLLGALNIWGQYRRGQYRRVDGQRKGVPVKKACSNNGAEARISMGWWPWGWPVLKLTGGVFEVY